MEVSHISPSARKYTWFLLPLPLSGDSEQSTEFHQALHWSDRPPQSCCCGLFPGFARWICVSDWNYPSPTPMNRVWSLESVGGLRMIVQSQVSKPSVKLHCITLQQTNKQTYNQLHQNLGSGIQGTLKKKVNGQLKVKSTKPSNHCFLQKKHGDKFKI